LQIFKIKNYIPCQKNSNYLFLPFHLISGFTQIVEITQTSNLIIEGKVIAINSSWNSERIKTYTEYSIRIESILKGMYDSKVIKIRTNGGRVGDSFVLDPHTSFIRKGQKGYFFSNPFR